MKHSCRLYSCTYCAGCKKRLPEGPSDQRGAGELLLSLLWAAHAPCQCRAPVFTQTQLSVVCRIWPFLSLAPALGWLPLVSDLQLPFLFIAHQLGNINVHICGIYILKNDFGLNLHSHWFNTSSAIIWAVLVRLPLHWIYHVAYSSFVFLFLSPAITDSLCPPAFHSAVSFVWKNVTQGIFFLSFFLKRVICNYEISIQSRWKADPMSEYAHLISFDLLCTGCLSCKCCVLSCFNTSLIVRFARPQFISNQAVLLCFTCLHLLCFQLPFQLCQIVSFHHSNFRHKLL